MGVEWHKEELIPRFHYSNPRRSFQAAKFNNASLLSYRCIFSKLQNPCLSIYSAIMSNFCCYLAMEWAGIPFWLVCFETLNQNLKFVRKYGRGWRLDRISHCDWALRSEWNGGMTQRWGQHKIGQGRCWEWSSDICTRMCSNEPVANLGRYGRRPLH